MAEVTVKIILKIRGHLYHQINVTLSCSHGDVIVYLIVTSLEERQQVNKISKYEYNVFGTKKNLKLETQIRFVLEKVGNIHVT